MDTDERMGRHTLHVCAGLWLVSSLVEQFHNLRMQSSTGPEHLVAVVRRLRTKRDGITFQIRELSSCLGKHNAHRDDIPNFGVQIEAPAKPSFQGVGKIDEGVGCADISHAG